jgi:hypothetical protein
MTTIMANCRVARRNLKRPKAEYIGRYARLFERSGFQLPVWVLQKIKPVWPGSERLYRVGWQGAIRMPQQLALAIQENWGVLLPQPPGQ